MFVIKDELYLLPETRFTFPTDFRIVVIKDAVCLLPETRFTFPTDVHTFVVKSADLFTPGDAVYISETCSHFRF